LQEFTIGSLARQANVNIETIRFYERKGLMPNPQRTPAGFRVYSQKDLQRLNFILMAKKHGFTLKEIKELLDLRVNPDSTCDDVRKKAEIKIKLIEQKLQELRRMKKALKTLMASCHGSNPAGECPILEAFEHHK